MNCNSQGLTFEENHGIDLRHDSRHITLARIKVDLCTDLAGLFLRNFDSQKDGFIVKL